MAGTNLASVQPNGNGPYDDKVLELCPHPAWICAADSLQILAVNTAAIEHYGFPRREFLALTLKELGTPPEVPALLTTLAGFGAPHCVVDRPFRQRKKDGTLIDVELSSSALCFAGRAARFVTAIDITEKRRRTEALEQRVAELTTVLDTIPLAVAIARDKRCETTIVNRASAEMLGLKNGENLLRSADHRTLPFKLFRNGKELELDERPMQQAAARGVPVKNVELDLVRGDGEERTLFEHAIPLLDTSGSVRGSVGVFVDITDRRRAERALSESEERFRGAFEQAAVGIAQVSPEGACMMVNNRLCEITGYAREDLLAPSFRDLTHPDDARAELKLVHQLLAGEIRTYALETRYRHKAGHFVCVKVTVSLVRAPDGLPRYLIVVVEDISDRKRVEADLRFTQQQIALAQKAGRSGSFDWDLTTNRNEWSAEMLDLYGMEQTEFHGSPEDWIECVLPADRVAALNAIEQSLQSGEFKLEFRIRRRDSGEIRWLHGRGQVFFDEDHVPIRIMGINMDITELKRAEAAQGEAFALLDSLLANAPIGFVFVDKQHRCTRINDYLCRINGLSREAALGRTIGEVLPAIAANVAPLIDKVIHTGEPLVGLEMSDGSADRPDVRQHWLTGFYPVRDAAGDLTQIGAFVVDITERKRNEEMLAQALLDKEQAYQLLNTMIARAPIGIAFFDRDFRFQLVNQPLAEMNGIPIAEHIGRTPWELVPTLAAQAEPMFKSVMATGEPLVEYELVGETSSSPGETRYWVESWFPIRMQDTITGVGALVQEVTERKRAEQALREADRRKDEFLAMLAHELRNPLAPIRNAAAVLERLSSNDRRLEWAGTIIERQVEHLNRLVDDLLDVSRVTRGKITLMTSPVEVRTFIERAIEITRPLAEGKHHEIVFRFPEQPMQVEGDAVRLAQVVANLLNNAVKYTDEGGRIDVCARVEGTNAVIEVSDNGIGIAPEQLPHVFGLFTQADSSLDRAQGGLGIGLTLAQKLAELHGGSISAASPGLGCGSTFTVRLPLLPVPTVQAPDHTAFRRKPSRPLRILIVDDNADAAESMGRLLEMEGHEVKVVFGGTLALSAADTFKPHVVLLDIGLPGMDGFEVSRRLRAMPQAKDVLLIALTGYGGDKARREAVKTGFNYYLVKPVAVDRLLDIVGSFARTLGPDAAGNGGTGPAELGEA